MKTFDFISYQPSLYSEGNMRFKTNFGGITQLMFAIINISGILYFSKDIYYRLNPNVIESTSVIDNPPEWVITPSDFNFIFSMNDPDSYAPYKNESIYSVEFYITIVEGGVLKEYKQLSTEPCSLDNFEGVDPGIFTPNFAFNSYYCINKNETVSLKGVLTSSSINYYKFFVKACNNETSKVPCASQQVLDKMLDGTMITLYHVDKIFDPSNYTHPVKHYFNNYWQRVSKKFYNVVTFYFKTVNFIDDTGLFFEASSKSTTLKVDRIAPSYDLQSSENFLEVLFMFNNNVTTFNRKYKRLQQVVAEIGGLVNAAFILFTVIVHYYTQSLYFEYIKEKLFDSKKELGLLNNNIESSLNNIKNVSEISLTPVIHLKPNDMLRSKFGRLSIEGGGVVRSNHISNSKHNRTVIFNKIRELMDYENFIKRFKEIELLKHLILNEEGSRKLFNEIINSKKSTIYLLSGHMESEDYSPNRQVNHFEALTNFKKITDKI
jgi:hypothetical protein